MKISFQRLISYFKQIDGNSLAEFATTTALMATLAATAAPKMSELSESAKGEKSRNEIDKIIKQAGQFYQDIAEEEGRGRFPNQLKFDSSIGGPGGSYSNRGNQENSLANDTLNSFWHTKAVMMDLGIDPDASDWGEWNDGWDKYDEEHWSVYQSVFGGKNTSYIYEDVYLCLDAECNEITDYTVDYQTGIQDAPEGDTNEWASLFGGEVLESKFQDGHYVYTVVAGGGTGEHVYPPTIYVLDIESAVDFNNVLTP